MSYVTANGTFNITVPLTVVLMSILGGTRQWAGPAIGAAVITALMYAFTAGDWTAMLDFFDQHLGAKKADRSFDRFPTEKELDEAASAAAAGRDTAAPGKK